MSKVVSSFELSLGSRCAGQTLADWLYSELRTAILERRLKADAKLPASRDFARLYGVSRGTVVSAFERLQDEGYIYSRVGVGTRVNARVFNGRPTSRNSSEVPGFIRRAVSG